jgi:PAS domain S-box-containing protein
LSLFSVSEDQIIGLNILGVSTDERVLHCVKTSLSGTPSGFAGKYTTTTGKKIHIDSYNVPIFSDGHTVSGAIVVMADIGDKIVVERALRESEKNLASMFDSIKESVFLIDTTGVLLAMNQTTAQRLRSTVDNMLGKSAYDFLPEDIATYRRGKMEEVIRTRKVVNFEDVRFGRHCKHAFYPVFNDKGDVNRLAIFTQDVHDLKMAEKALRENEEKARALVDAKDDAVVLFDRDGVLLDMNDAYAGLIKMEKEAIIGKCIWDYYPQEVSKFRKEFLEQVFLTGQPAVLSDKRNNRIYDSRAYPILSAAGVTTRAALFIRDVTEKNGLKMN